MGIKAAKVRQCEQEVRNLRDQLKAFDTNRMTTGSRDRTGPATDTTATSKQRIKDKIAELEALIAKG